MLFSLLYMGLRAVFRLAPAGDQRDREVEIEAFESSAERDDAS